MATKWLATLAGTLVLALAIGCGSDDEPDNGASKPADGTDEPSVAMVTAADVETILNTRCMPCHGGAEPQEDLNLETVEGLLKGGEHGAVVVPGDAANSKVVKAMRGGDADVPSMPPKGDKVPEDEIKKIEDWINAGASAS